MCFPDHGKIQTGESWSLQNSPIRDAWKLQKFSGNIAFGIRENSAPHPVNVCQIPLCAMHESFSPLPFSSDYFRNFRIIPVGNSYHVYIFSIYHSALLPPPEATPPCQTLICCFKAFISPQQLRHRRDAESSPADVLEPCRRSGVLRMSGRATQGKQYYHVGDLVMLLTVTGCYPLLFHHVGDLIHEEFYLHTFLYFLCT